MGLGPKWPSIVTIVSYFVIFCTQFQVPVYATLVSEEISMAWKKGQSGNPKGRPKGFAGVAKSIMKETRDGAEMIEWALRIWRDPSQDLRDRQWAFNWLSDRGLGKPVQTIDLQAEVHTDVSHRLDFTHLSTEELAAAEEVFMKLHETKKPKQLPEIIDAEVVDEDEL